MSLDREALTLECRLRLIELADKRDPEEDPLDSLIDVFWEGVHAMNAPRSVETLNLLISKRRARASGLIKG